MLSVFLPSFLSSSSVCAESGPPSASSMAAAEMSSFMIVLPSPHRRDRARPPPAFLARTALPRMTRAPNARRKRLAPPPDPVQWREEQRGGVPLPTRVFDQYRAFNRLCSSVRRAEALGPAGTRAARLRGFGRPHRPCLNLKVPTTAAAAAALRDEAVRSYCLFIQFCFSRRSESTMR